MEQTQELPSDSDTATLDRRRIGEAPPQQREALVDRLCETLLARLGVARVDVESR